MTFAVICVALLHLLIYAVAIQPSTDFTFTSAYFCLCTQQIWCVSGNWGTNAKSRRLALYFGFYSKWLFHSSWSVLYVLACYRTQKGISLYSQLLFTSGVKRFLQMMVLQHPFLLLTSLFQCVLSFFYLYMQNEKLGLKNLSQHVWRIVSQTIYLLSDLL